MIHIVFGTQTGNAQNLAHLIGENLLNSGIENKVFDMSEISPEDIHQMDSLLVVTSTYGDGEAPDNASEWLSYLKFNEDLDLSHLKFSVIGLGDSYYPHFCQCAKDFDEYLSTRGATQLTARLDCDRYYEEEYKEWLVAYIQALGQETH
jgi:sulfite reductase (NADPH) flavoprotein alpha-component